MKLLSIPEAMKRNVSVQDTVIGFVVPVYMWGIPRIAQEFLEQFPTCPDTYFFGVANCANSVGSAFTQMRSLLKIQNNSLHAEFKIVLPGNYTPLYGPPGEARQMTMIDQAEESAAEAADVIRRRDRKLTRRNPLTCFLSLLIYGPAMKRIQRVDERFLLEDTCTGCGICESVCSVGNVMLVQNKPEWLHRCEHCLACLHWCPEEAIQFGNLTRGRKRYRNPQVSLQDMQRREWSEG